MSQTYRLFSVQASIVFDKTGTLKTGQTRINRVFDFGTNGDKRGQNGDTSGRKRAKIKPNGIMLLERKSPANL